MVSTLLLEGPVLSFLALGCDCNWMLESFLISQVKRKHNTETIVGARCSEASGKIWRWWDRQEEKGRKQEGKEGRTKVISDKISVIVPDCSYCLLWLIMSFTLKKYSCAHNVKLTLYYVKLLPHFELSLKVWVDQTRYRQNNPCYFRKSAENHRSINRKQHRLSERLTRSLYSLNLWWDMTDLFLSLFFFIIHTQAQRFMPHKQTHHSSSHTLIIDLSNAV